MKEKEANQAIWALHLALSFVYQYPHDKRTVMEIKGAIQTLEVISNS